MSDYIQNVCNWLDETEEDNLLYDSDDTDADPDFVCTNTHNEIDSESDTDVDVHINPSQIMPQLHQDRDLEVHSYETISVTI